MKNQIQEIHDFIFNKIEDYQASTLEGATNGPMEKCYYEKSPEFGYSHTAFDEWKLNYQEEIDSIAGIQRSHSQGVQIDRKNTYVFLLWRAIVYGSQMGTLFESDESTIEHSDMYRAAEDLVDVYKQMVFDMVDHCKTDEAINECKAENFEKCEKQVGCSESKFNLAMILKSTLIS